MVVPEILSANNRQFPALARPRPQTMHFHSSIHGLFRHSSIRRPFPAQNADEPAVRVRNDHVVARQRLGVTRRSGGIADKGAKACETISTESRL
jgi:hypothetical protein